MTLNPDQIRKTYAEHLVAIDHLYEVGLSLGVPELDEIIGEVRVTSDAHRVSIGYDE